MSEKLFWLIAELVIRFYTIIVLIIGICLMPHFTGLPRTTWIIPLGNITLGLTAMWSTKTFLVNGIIPVDTILLYGIIPTFAVVYLTRDLIKFLTGR